MAAAAESQEERRRAALAAGSAPAKQVAAVPPAAARATASGAIIAGIIAFLASIRQADKTWLTTNLSALAPVDDVATVVAEEDERATAFAEGVAKRVGHDLGAALAIPDPVLRDATVKSIMEREKRYARMRSQAMAARAFAAVNRMSVRRDSPHGALWKLDPTVSEHTPGCLFMGGRFWPWAVLDRVHPPRHPGCPCKLLSYGEALASGDLKPGDVRPVGDAIAEASGVVMEAAVAQGLLDELELRDRLVESGAATVEALAAIPLGAV